MALGAHKQYVMAVMILHANRKVSPIIMRNNTLAQITFIPSTHNTHILFEGEIIAVLGLRTT